ncbi:mandelate racemase/muconate lactonizing enzyme family protein [Halovenus halobia]|uniref:mandelate racemase/muconate lactonizing enzyme family protein n=1 Tax=Halovenus halobia TaxID=3396622 RepID=UPI003F5624D1
MSEMQITGVTQHHVSYPLEESFAPTWIPDYAQHTHEAEVFEVETDAGITGVTASPSFAGGLEYETPLSLFLAGEDPHDIESIMSKLASIDLVGPRPWHIELALWDIIGKDAGKPVYELLGGSDEPIPAYASTGQMLPAAERIEYVEDRVDEGFEAVKLRITEPADLDIVRDVRDAFPELTLMVDANKGWAVRVMDDEQTWTVKEATAVAKELEEIGGVEWFEEPLPRHNYDGYARLREMTTVPIAGGEFNERAGELHQFLDRDAVDVLQPDAALVTGIKRAVEVAGRAREEGVNFVPHTWTNAIGFAANLHVIAAIDGAWCEFPHDPPWTPDAWGAIVSEPFEATDGLVRPREKPGLGIELDRDVVGGA